MTTFQNNFRFQSLPKCNAINTSKLHSIFLQQFSRQQLGNFTNKDHSCSQLAQIVAQKL